MATSNSVDRYSHILWIMLLILGVLLTIAGWAQFAF
jgi:flagellar basal body-associated protein FliL